MMEPMDWNKDYDLGFQHGFRYTSTYYFLRNNINAQTNFVNMDDHCKVFVIDNACLVYIGQLVFVLTISVANVMISRWTIIPLTAQSGQCNAFNFKS